MSDLFNMPKKNVDWSPVAGRDFPVIELQKLVLLEHFAAPERKEIRIVEFKRGLNIIWADPKVEQARAGGDRTSGHSAGKTTLCRILRWLLGETHYGNSDLESRIATKFPKGWAILALTLDDEPWVVGRSFWSKQDYQAAHGATLEEIFENGWPKDSSAKAFQAELERLTLSPLEKKRFPGRDEDIEWPQLLAWLARDQEAALQSVEHWRSSAGGPQDRGPTQFERHMLIRLVADLLSKEEWAEMDKEERLKAERDKLKSELPGLLAIADEACEPLRRVFGGDGGVLPGDLTISKARQALTEKKSQLNKINVAIAEHEAKRALANHEQALRELERTEGEVAQRSRRSRRFEKQLSELAGAVVKAKAVLEMRTPPPGYCGRKREEAKECPLYIDGAVNIAAVAAFSDLEQRQQDVQARLDEEASELAELDSKLPVLRNNEEALRASALSAVGAREELVKQAERLGEQIALDNAVLAPATVRRQAYDQQSATVESLSEQIRESRQRQSDIRKAHWNDRLDLAEHYRTVLSELLGPKVGGSISFDKEGQLVLEAENRSALSSAAIEALKTVSFDLASVFRSVAGGGNHPRLLIHDSPKVADMSPVPYAALFDLVKKVEALADAKPTFQYIVTTTEPPPQQFLNSGHIVLTLDASTKGGRLFKEDL